MEPKLPTPNYGHEHTPVGYGQTFEHSLPTIANPETQVDRGAEQLEKRESSPVPILPTPVVDHALPAVPVPAVTSIPAPAAPADDMPLTANDDDLIEKEWVDKAKKIIIDTKDDPYRREKEVSRLQADYLRKRYGRELGATQ